MVRDDTLHHVAGQSGTARQMWSVPGLNKILNIRFRLQMIATEQLFTGGPALGGAGGITDPKIEGSELYILGYRWPVIIVSDPLS